VVIVGQYYTRDLMQEWFLKKGLPVARKVLSNFNILNELFSSFKGYENKKYKQANNVVLHMCLPNVWGGHRPEDIKQLNELEKALSMFKVLNWKSKRLNHLKSRLCSDNYYTSLSAYTELVIAKWLASKFGKDKVEIYPRLSTGKFSDILVKLGAKKVYLEVGNLGESLPEKKIQRIVDEAAKYLGKKLKKLCYLKVIIDTAELAFDENGHIDEEGSIRKITSEIDRLCLEMLESFEGSVRLEEFADILSNIELYKEIASFNYTFQKYMKLLEKPCVKRWVNSCKNQIAQGSKLIKYIHGYKSETLLVEIHTEHIYPSPAAEAELNSIINHVTRHIKDQLKKQQLQPNSPNIIVIQSYKLVAFDFVVFYPFIKLLLKIKEFFNQKREKNLSGIILFSTDFDRSIFIANNQAGETSKLSKSEVEMLARAKVF